MTDFDPLDDFAEDFGAPLSLAEKERVRERLMRLNEDPVRIDVGDREVVDFTERQFGRIIGDDGQPVRRDFERFRPSVGPNDLFLFGSVGDEADNAPEDVFKVKKLLQRAAGTEFRPGIEGLGEADPRTVNTLKNIQATNNLEVDGRVEPGGPTLHALGFRALGPENGRPTPLAAHEFETRFGKSADRDERGQPIVATNLRLQQTSIGEGGLNPEIGTGGNQPPAAERPAFDDPKRSTPGTQSPDTRPVIGEIQLAQLDRKVLPSNPRHPLHLSQERKADAQRSFEQARRDGIRGLTRTQKIDILRLLWAKRTKTQTEKDVVRRVLLSLPTPSAIRSFDEKKKSELIKALFANRTFTSAYSHKNWTRMTQQQQIRVAQRVTNIFSQVYGIRAYKVTNKKLPGNAVGRLNPGTGEIFIDLSKINKGFAPMHHAFDAIFEEAYHAYQAEMVEAFVLGKLSASDPRWARVRTYGLNMFLYMSDQGPIRANQEDYERQPFEADAKVAVKSLSNGIGDVLRSRNRRRKRR